MASDSARTEPAATNAGDAPAQAAVERAEHAFAVGDYRALRGLLPALQATPARARAEQWARSIAIDPIQLAVLASSALALAAIAIHYGAS